MDTCFRIKELRQALGLTQAELAGQLNLKSPSTVTMWENGDRRPPSTILPRLAIVLHCTVDELYSNVAPSNFQQNNIPTIH